MKIFFKTLGCPKNFNDTQVASGILQSYGHQIVNNPDIADAIIVNTCGFINDAKKESIDAIFEMSKIKKQSESKSKLLVVTGCLSQRYGEELFDEIPESDIILGVNDYNKLPSILDQYDGKRKKYLSKYDCNIDYSDNFRKIDDNPYTATIKIAEGCDNHCTYCVIPSIRGKYRSRKPDSIISEAIKLAQHGCKELILVAQDTTAYGNDLKDINLSDLLKKLCSINGIEWIRILYAYEDKIDDDLIKVISDEPKICNYLDIPIQHCNNDILKSMNRKSTKSSITKTIQKLRTSIPDIHIRTTLITGFPGETDNEFEEMMDFIIEQKFDRLGVFAYSPEEGTPAEKMPNQIPEKIKNERKEALMRRQMDISLDANKKLIGSKLEVIIDSIDEDDISHKDTANVNVYLGRTRYDAPDIDNSVIIQTSLKHKIGDIIKVFVTDAFDYDIVGTEI